MLARAETMPIDASSVKAYLDCQQPDLLVLFGAPHAAGVQLARRHAAVMDHLLHDLHRSAAAECAQRGRPVPQLALAAVGGYGRQLLGWKSDLDLRWITADKPERAQPFAEAILYPLWDAGVSVGHQVVTPSDLIEDAAHDLPTATALLDLRPISGDGSLVPELKLRAFASVFARARLPDFLQRLEAEAGARHERFRGSGDLLEPDIKSGVGGLRDLDLALWAAGARFQSSELSALCRMGVLAAGEAEELALAADFLWDARNRLHRRAGRKSDRLTFSEQEQIAGELGYRNRIGARPGATDGQIASVMAEAFMSDYQRHTHIICQGSEQLLASSMPRLCRQPRGMWRFTTRRVRAQDLGQGLQLQDQAIALADPVRLESDPALALRLVAVALARDLPLAAETRRDVARVAREAAFGAALRASPEAASLFLGLLVSSKRTALRDDSILGELHALGLLSALIPEFNALVGRAHHDIYHVYSVDVHSIRAVDHLRALTRGELSEQLPLATRLASEVTRREVLFLAALLHDLGKARDGRGHARRGAEMARPILDRLGLDPNEVEQTCRLILHHLSMYSAATRRDLDDQWTLAQLAPAAQDRPELRTLYLLTLADLSTTGPSPVSGWMLGMLDTLFRSCDARLASGAASPACSRVRVREQAAGCDVALDGQFLAEFVDTMPGRYLTARTPAQIAAHARVALAVRDESVNADLVPSRHPELAELCVVTAEGAGGAAGLGVVAGDRPGLLAAIAAALAANRLDVHAAQIHWRPLAGGGIQAVDLFWVRDPIEGVARVARTLPKLQRDLRDVITGQVGAYELLKARASSHWSERPAPAVTTQVTLEQETSPQHTLIEVLTRDQPGVLFTLAEALYRLGLSIALAKINTEGARVIDVFYVTEGDGKKIAPGARTLEVQTALLAALAAFSPSAASA